MYGLPSTFDTSIFVGRTLHQVCFSANTINLIFDQALMITLESSFIHTPASGGAGLGEGVVPVMESKLMQLAERTVTKAEVQDRGTLVLHFDDGQTLSCVDDSPNFESYRITHGAHEIVV